MRLETQEDSRSEIFDTPTATATTPAATSRRPFDLSRKNQAPAMLALSVSQPQAAVGKTRSADDALGGSPGAKSSRGTEQAPVVGMADSSGTDAVGDKELTARTPTSSVQQHHDILAFRRLNMIIQARSRRAELVIMNLPDIWDHEDPAECEHYVQCCESLVSGLDRVLFVHSSGYEIFNI